MISTNLQIYQGKHPKHKNSLPNHSIVLSLLELLWSCWSYEEIGLSKSNTPPSSNRFFHFPTGPPPITRVGFGHTLALSQSGAPQFGAKLETGLVSLGTKKNFRFTPWAAKGHTINNLAPPSTRPSFFPLSSSVFLRSALFVFFFSLCIDR